MKENLEHIFEQIEGRCAANRLPYAYVFERFPSFTQTFCAREVEELSRQGRQMPLVFSIRSVDEEPRQDFAQGLKEGTIYLPERAELAQQVEWLKDQGKVSKAAVLLLRHWQNREDKSRLYEALWIGYFLELAGVYHLHAHFAGLAARTCWWLRQLSGRSYSLTAHANDVFCERKQLVSLQRLLEDARYVVTVSDYTARWLREKFTRAAPIYRIYNGLDLSVFEGSSAGVQSRATQAQKTEAAAASVRIVSVGRLIEKKGFFDLLKAADYLRAGGQRFELMIIGDGPLEQQLQREAMRYGLQKLVTFTGSLPQQQVRQALFESDIFCLPCIEDAEGGMDNLPTVIAEAMAAGLPTVSTRLAGIPEMVLNEKTGLLVEPKEPKQIADALLALLENAELRQRYAQAARAHALATFDQKTTVAALRKLLRSGGKAHGAAWFARLLRWKLAAPLSSYFRQRSLRWKVPKGVKESDFVHRKFQRLLNRK